MTAVFAGSAVWVTNSQDDIGRSVERVGSGFGAIWATSASEDTIVRVEPAPLSP